jgi:hypothetical protein
MQYGINVDEMRAELEQYTKTSIDIPDSHIEAAYMTYRGAIDPQRPNWSRHEMELLFEYICDGNGDVMFKMDELRSKITRHSEYPGDEIGRWLDNDELDAAV